MVHILPGQDLGCSCISGTGAVGNTHTIFTIPCRYLGFAKGKAIAAVVGLLNEIQHLFHGQLLRILNGQPGSGIVCVTSSQKNLIDIFLGHSKSGGCCNGTLRLVDVCNLFRFCGKEGKLLIRFGKRFLG